MYNTVIGIICLVIGIVSIIKGKAIAELILRYLVFYNRLENSKSLGTFGVIGAGFMFILLGILILSNP